MIKLLKLFVFLLRFSPDLVQSLSRGRIQLKHLLQPSRVEFHLHVILIGFLIIIVVVKFSGTSSHWILLVFNRLFLLQIHLTAIPFLFFFLILIAVAFRWFTQLYVILNDFICKNHSLLRPPDPWRLWLYLNYVHIKMLQNLKVKLNRNLRLFHKRNAEVHSCPHWSTERQHELRENRTKPILWWKWIKFCFILVIWLGAPFIKFSQRFLRQ